MRRVEPDQGIVWITGASSGIGRALALMLARQGFRVAVTARSLDALLELQNESRGASGSIIVLDGDVTHAADMERVVNSIEYDHGGLSMAILNAGVFIPVRGGELKVEDFDKTFAVNLSGVVNCLVPAVNVMKGRRRGRIVMVSSVTGYGGLPTSAAYGATKAALINMAESLKFDLDPLGVDLQIVNPGFVETPATAQNAFEMPALVSAETAAKRIVDGIGAGGFEITFPRRFTYVLKLLRFLPYGLYFPLVRKATKWDEQS